MIINKDNLSHLYFAAKASFAAGIGMTSPLWQTIATKVPSSTRTENYDWIGSVPKVREWLGDRHVKNLTAFNYNLSNKDYEITLGVDRNDIKDDATGAYGPRFTQLGQSTAQHADDLVWDLVLAGATELCYDGKAMFATDHPHKIDGTVSNWGAGSGAMWVLADTSNVLKPLIFQMRQEWDFQSFTDMSDERVFMHKQYLFGADARMNVGFGFWQTAYASKQTLDEAAFWTAREALMTQTDDEGHRLRVMPKTLFVDPSNEKAAREILLAANLASGETNISQGLADIVVVPHLAG
jgi:phage major head subunit gpT-like protein